MIQLPSGDITIVLKTDTNEFTYKLKAVNVLLETIKEDIYPHRTREGFAYVSDVPTMNLTASVLDGEILIAPLDKAKPTKSHRLLEVLI